MIEKFDTRRTECLRAAEPATWIRRATRLPFRAPVAFRPSYGATWSDGELVDISRTGVLFAPGDLAIPDPDLRLVIFLSRAALESRGIVVPVPDLYCGGAVIRTTKIADGRHAVALRFDYEWAGRPPGELGDLGSKKARRDGGLTT